MADSTLSLPWRPGILIGPYRVLDRIGAGGMGSVYRATPAESCPVAMGRVVAVKVLRSIDPEERRRFEREARYLSSLQHPGIVRVLDTGEHDGHPYLVMPLIEGERFDQVARKNGPLAETHAAELMVQALEALHVAHLAGILHRDLKPGNLMVDSRQQVRLLDFGLAAAPAYESSLTQAGDVVGTPAYMSPEQAAGARTEVGRRSDVYSMGAVFYELLTGQPPYSRSTAIETLRAVLDEPVVAPVRLRPGLDPRLSTIVLVAMAREPIDRYRTAEEMAADLRRFLAGQGIRARQPSPVRIALRDAWRHRREMAIYGLVAFLLVAFGGLVAVRLRPRSAAVVVVPEDPDAWRLAYPVPGSGPGSATVAWEPVLRLGNGVLAGPLPPVAGPVRLAASAVLSAKPEAFAALLVTDRDLAQGYQLRLQRSGGAPMLTLLREDRAMSTRLLGEPDPASAIQLELSNLDGALSATAAWTTRGEAQVATMDFIDLVPLPGELAKRTWVLRRDATLDGIRLQRRRVGEMLSPLAAADAFLHDGLFHHALREYGDYLASHASGALARDARLRMGLAQMGLEEWETALATFTRVAEENRTEPRYVMVATFHAWLCAFRLGRHDLAETHFATLRADYDLERLAGAIPQSMLEEIERDHVTRAEALPPDQAQRAAFLILTADEIARQLGAFDRSARYLLLAGDRFLALGQTEVARQTWLRVVSHRQVPTTLQGLANLRIGHALRLSGDTIAAAAAYARALDQVAPADKTWAALWQGDLLADSDPAAAERIWATWADGQSQGGRLLKRLATSNDAGLVTDQPETRWVAWRIRRALNDPAADRLLSELIQAHPGQWPVPLALRYQVQVRGTPERAPRSRTESGDTSPGPHQVEEDPEHRPGR